MQKKHITVGTHERMKRLGYEAAREGALAPEPVVNEALVALLSPEAIQEMKDSFAEGFYEAKGIHKAVGD